MDQFYTLPRVAQECIDKIPNIEQYDKIIEPSAGSGSFSNLINCIAYDIEPMSAFIMQKDFFTIEKQKANHLLILGNPPFGSRSKLAKDFIKHSIKIGAETIAFILPSTFSKLSNQSKTIFPLSWRLILDEPLSSTDFMLPDGKKYHVPCRFYIWTKQKGDLNLRKKKLDCPNDFEFRPRGDQSADFSINGNNGKIKELNEITNSKSEHYIKAKEKTKEELIEIFSQIKYDWYSSVNGGNAWIGQQEIIEKYLDFISKVKSLEK